MTRRPAQLFAALAIAALTTTAAPSAIGHVAAGHAEPTTALAPAPGFEAYGRTGETRSYHTEIELFETLLSHGHNDQPQNVFALVNAYVAANQQGIGQAFFAQLDAAYGATMAPAGRAHILAAQGLLRALHADDVFLLRRIGWVRDTFAVLDQAAGLAPDDPWVMWSAGLVYAQVPGFFGKRDDALAVLTALADAPHTEPLPGMYREVYRHLAILHGRAGDAAAAAEYQRRSGLADLTAPGVNIGWFAVDAENGARMAARPTLDEVVPGRVFSVYGFGFSDLHFVVSADGSQLIAIDAGTQPAATARGLALLRAAQPDLPPIATLIVTHAHWDHIGGTTALLVENPDLTIVGNAHFHDVRERSQRGHVYTDYFRSAAFDPAWLDAYEPDRLIAEPTTIDVGGSTVSLVPVDGGETEDGLLVHFPDLDTVFVGDVLMPFFGDPWVDEGNVPAALDTIDTIAGLDATHIVHGHRPLTLIYGPEQLEVYGDALAWLIDRTVDHLGVGYARQDIQRLNLIPAGLETEPQAWLGYLAGRDHVIARLADAMVGIWQEDRTGRAPEGLFNITLTDRANLLSRYLGLSRGQVTDAIAAMLDAGDNELALQVAVAAERDFDSPRLRDLQQRAAANLRAANQYLDPFKFAVFARIAGAEVAFTDAPTDDHPHDPPQVADR